MIDLTQTLITQNSAKPTFGINEERAIISLAQDYPEFFSIVARFVKPQMFQDPACQIISAIILNALEKYDLIPSRLILRDMVLSALNEDQHYQPIVDLLDRPSNPREVPVIRDRLTEWAKKSAYGLLYTPEAMIAYEAGKYDEIEKIVKDAERISDTEINGLWLLDNAQIVLDPQSILHLTTGFNSLDELINNGGPSKKEVFIWMGGTNSGKCHTLDSNIICYGQSHIYELELENGEFRQLRGSRIVQTQRGAVEVCDLTEDDDVIEVSSVDDTWDLELPTMWL